MTDLQDLLARVWNDLLARPSGALHFRFLIQPLMAVIIGIRDGIRDARTGRRPYFWTIIADPALRRRQLREGIAATGKIVLLAFLLDAAYQIMALGAFYPGEALIVAVALGFIPYLLVRGPAARIARPTARAGPGGIDDGTGSRSR